MFHGKVEAGGSESEGVYRVPGQPRLSVQSRSETLKSRERKFCFVMKKINIANRK